MTLTTNTGKVFYISWIGISSKDKKLRFSVKNTPMIEILTVFNNPLETERLAYAMDSYSGEENEFIEIYEGFTVFGGIINEDDNNTIVILAKP